MSKKIIGLLSLIAVLGMVLAPSFALAQDDLLDISEHEPPAYTAEEVLGILPRIINYVFGFLIAMVVFMIIIAAFVFVTAGGNPEKVALARRWLTYALIGLAIGVLAQGLVRLVLLIVGEPAAVDVDIIM